MVYMYRKIMLFSLQYICSFSSCHFVRNLGYNDLRTCTKHRLKTTVPVLCCLSHVLLKINGNKVFLYMYNTVTVWWVALICLLSSSLWWVTIVVWKFIVFKSCICMVRSTYTPQNGNVLYNTISYACRRQSTTNIVFQM